MSGDTPAAQGTLRAGRSLVQMRKMQSRAWIEGGATTAEEDWLSDNPSAGLGSGRLRRAISALNTRIFVSCETDLELAAGMVLGMDVGTGETQQAIFSHLQHFFCRLSWAGEAAGSTMKAV